jgi:predicted phosphoribosyltransferase
MKTGLFKDRRDAGKFLARSLEHHAHQSDVQVLALPRGGVPVGYEIATALGLPLDVFIVRKLGVPGYEELAMGAIASGGVRVLNDEIIDHLNIPRKAIDAVAVEELAELERRQKLYRGTREPVQIQNQRIILVDDGLATGSSMRAAVRALRQRHPAAITVAVPVAAKDTCDQFRSEVEEIVCGATAEPFLAVGHWYEDFTQITDEEVSELLNHAAHLRRIERVRKEGTPASEPVAR